MDIYDGMGLLLVLVSMLSVLTLLVLVFGANMLYANWTTGVPWAKSPTDVLEQAIASLKLPPSALICDLGCGDGRLLFIAEKFGLKAVGYELAWYPYLKAIIRKYTSGSKVRIYRRDFLKQDLSSVDAIFLFLTASVMSDIGKSLEKYFFRGIPIVSYGFPIPNWKPKKVLPTTPSKTYYY